jgi:LysM repeat protein
MRTVAMAVLVGATLALGGCGDDRGAAGMIITDDGRMLANTAENDRAQCVYVIDKELTAKLAPHWCARGAIAELPIWADDRDESGEWRWEKATVTIALTGDGKAPLPLSVPEITAGVTDYLRVHVHHPGVNLTVTVTQTVSADQFNALLAAGIYIPGASVQQTFAPSSQPETATAQPATTIAPAGAAVGSTAPATGAVAGPRTYVVQAGDTLADITTLFYGTNTQWRKIVAANPGLDPGHLVPGTSLVIP